MKKIFATLLAICAIVNVSASDPLVKNVKEIVLTGELRGIDLEAIQKLINMEVIDMEKAEIVDSESFEEDYTEIYSKKGELPYRMFTDMERIKKARIPENTQYIGSYAFSGCIRLTDIEIPSSVKTIDMSAFTKCISLKKIVIPDNVISIGNYIFHDCKNLETVYLSNNLTEIPETSFTECNNLKNINIPDKLKHIRLGAFHNCFKIKDIILPESLIEIGDVAFNNCRELNYLVLPEGLEKIGSHVFGHSALESIVIPDKITTIKNGAFYGCEKLEIVTIGSSVDMIENDAFSWCPSLISVNIKALIPPVFIQDPFVNLNYENCTLYVPEGSLEAYKSAPGWDKFFNIEEKDFTSIEEISQDNIYVSDGNIVVESNNNNLIEVYSISGQLVRKATSNGRNLINVIPGSYIVKTGSVSKKVIVN